MSWKRDIVLFKQEGVYACFPLLQQLPDGRLVVGFTHRDWPTHCDPGRWRVLVSADGGESWQETLDTSLQLLWRGARGGFRCVTIFLKLRVEYVSELPGHQSFRFHVCEIEMTDHFIRLFEHYRKKITTDRSLDREILRLFYRYRFTRLELVDLLAR